MGYRYSTDPIHLSEASADLTVACALVANVPEVPDQALNVDFNDWKSAHEHVRFLFAIKAACSDPEVQSIRVEGEADDDAEYLTYEGDNEPRRLVELVTRGWGNQPAKADSNPLYTASNPAKAMDGEEVAQVLRALDVPFALGHLPKEDYGHTMRSRVISCLRRFEMANPRLRGNTLEETFQLRRELLARHGINLADTLARHLCLAAADPYRR
jgi:hypothetical protein